MNLTTTIPIKPRAGQRAKSGHPWVFSNEVEHPSPQLDGGELVSIRDDRDKFVGIGLYHPNSLVSVRLLTRNPNEQVCTVEWFHKRIVTATELRNRLYPERTACRLVYGESDGLPGIVIDYYNGIAAVQIHALGMEQRLELLTEALVEAIRPDAIVLRNNHERRVQEGLEKYNRVSYGECPESVEIDEYGVRFAVDVAEGQKTGHFFDQAENRQAPGSLVEGKTVLDLFCHTGAWGLAQLKAGAISCVFVDSSANACSQTQKNIELNGYSGQTQVIKQDAFEWLSEARASSEKYGVVIVDPPAFAKGMKQKRKALRGYEDLLRQCLARVESGGILCACSCSYFVSEDEFVQTLQKAAAREQKAVRVLEIRGQSRDHPVLISMPESRYLKCIIAQVIPL